MSAPHVWRADPRDAETIAAMLVEFRDHLGRTRPSDNAVHAGVERLLEQERDCDFLLAAPAPGEPAAALTQLRYRWSVWRAGVECRLEDLYVRDAARRGGLGAALVEAAVARARERAARWIELDTEDDNVPAQRLYARFGFQVGRTNGERIIVLARSLDDDS